MSVKTAGTYSCILILPLLFGSVNVQYMKRKIQPPTIQYEQVKGWPNLPPDLILGNPTGIGIDSKQNIFVFHRA